jgi:hypothetical protein
MYKKKQTKINNNFKTKPFAWTMVMEYLEDVFGSGSLAMVYILKNMIR